LLACCGAANWRQLAVRTGLEVGCEATGAGRAGAHEERGGDETPDSTQLAGRPRMTVIAHSPGCAPRT